MREIDGPMGTVSTARMSWNEICANKQYRKPLGRPRRVPVRRRDQAASEGTVIDADDDLAELCNRMKRENQHFCTILYCEAARQRTISRH